MKDKSIIISIIIPYYKRSNLVEKILLELESQSKNTNFHTEVLVIDSNTNSNLLNKQYRSLELKIFNTKNNISKKRNLGISKAKGEIIICIDDDCVPNKYFLTKHIESNKNVILPSLFSGQEVISPLNKEPKNFYKFRKQDIFLADINKLKNNYEIIFQTRSMNFSFSSRFKNLLPNFNESFKGYGWEDPIFFKNCIDNGFQIFQTEASIMHKLEETPKSFFKKQIFFGYWSYRAIYQLNLFELKKWQLFILNLIYKSLFFLRSLLFILYGIISKINYLISYKIGLYSYCLQKSNYYFSIIIGISSSREKSKKYNYD